MLDGSIKRILSEVFDVTKVITNDELENATTLASFYKRRSIDPAVELIEEENEKLHHTGS